MTVSKLRRGWSWPPDNGQKKHICTYMQHLIDRQKDKEENDASSDLQNNIRNVFKRFASPSSKAVVSSIEDTLKTVRIACLQRCKDMKDVVNTTVQRELKRYLQNVDKDGIDRIKNTLHLCGLDNSKRIKTDSKQKEYPCFNTIPSVLERILGVARFPNFQQLLCYPLYERNLEHYFSDNERTSSNPMSYEWIRLESFKTFPEQISVRPIRLAQAGFYYLGTDDKVCCYSCGKCYNGWTYTDDPLDIHRQISPLCSHINGGDSQNCPILYAEDLVATIHPQRSEQDENSPVVAVQPTSCRVYTNTTSPSRTVSAGIFSHLAHGNNTQSSVSTQLPYSSVNTPSSANTHLSQSSVSTQLPYSSANTHLSQSSVSTQLPYASISTQIPQSSVSTQLPQSSVNTHLSQSSVSTQLPQSSVSTQISQSSVSTQLPQSTSRTQSSVNTQSSLQTSTNPLGINFEKPKYPAYSVVSVRIDTFRKWPTNLTQSPGDMAAAGFFYAGYADYVRCFFCGGGLRSWDPYDDPWTEHARWFPRCVFLHQNKGNNFVTSVQQQQQQFETGDSEAATSTVRNENTTNPAQSESTDDVISNVAIQSVTEMGYHLNIVENAIKVLKARKGNVTIKAVDILDIILDLEDKNGSRHLAGINKDEKCCDLPAASSGDKSSEKTLESITETLECTSLQDETKSLVAENRRLKEQRLCKICLDQDSSVAFLPCGHLCCCAECAPAMRKCPICRTFVKGTVKTWLS